jgi:hypothetical protein
MRKKSNDSTVLFEGTSAPAAASSSSIADVAEKLNNAKDAFQMALHNRPQEEEQEEEEGELHCCWTLLGFSPYRTCWGSKLPDLGIGRSPTPWYADTAHHDHHHEAPPWFNTPWYHVPRQRHLWGEPQYEVHPGAQE